jgi:hypothetical protein
MRMLWLYPRPWLDRYEPEMRALLEEHHVRLRTLIDLAAGAARARLEADDRSHAKEATMAKGRSNSPRCSFCGKGARQVSRLVAGPGVYICDSCVELCHEVLAIDRQQGDPPAPPPTPARRPPPDLPRLFRAWLRNLFRTAAPNAG